MQSTSRRVVMWFMLSLFCLLSSVLIGVVALPVIGRAVFIMKGRADPHWYARTCEQSQKSAISFSLCVLFYGGIQRKAR